MKTCCICGKEFNGWGNNPAPLKKATEFCCDECNDAYVVPMRIYIATHEKENSSNNKE